jgi:ceramide glucosyltransferase
MGHFSWATDLRGLVVVLACGPPVYYLLSIYCAHGFFSRKTLAPAPSVPYQPPLSILKPVRGLDREAYENYASFCEQDYPEYEVLFAVSDPNDPAIPVIEQVARDYPERSVRLLVGAPRLGANSKVNKLCQLVREARYGLLVMSDSDVRVERDYLKQVSAPFQDPQVGAVTALFRAKVGDDLASHIDCVGSAVEFCSGAVVARRLEGMKFALGATMATTRERLAEIGGFEALVNHHADDFELGHRIAEQGYRVELLREPVWMVFPAEALGSFLRHELRWSIGLRNIRPLAHLGQVFTHGLPWALAAAASVHTRFFTMLFLAVYLVLRFTMAWVVGVWGLKDLAVRRNLWLVPFRDTLAFLVWLASFTSNRIQWRGLKFTIKNGLLVPVSSSGASGRG